MLLPPIVERELRVQARARGTYWLRVLAGLAAGGSLAACLLLEEDWALFRRTGHGPWLFALLHSAISLFFALTCPLMCVDTLAGERRQGTLGILLLTPLRPGSIVLGKMTVHLIRAFAMWLAIVPVLAIPFLMGGVGWVDITFALLLELGVVLASLAAGLIASSLSEQPGASMALAIALTILMGELLAWLSFLGLLPSLLLHPNSEYAKHFWITAIFGPWFLGTGLLENGFSGVLGRNPPWMTRALFTSLAAVTLGSLALAGFSFWFATRRIQSLNRLAQTSKRQLARRRFWLQPVLAGWHQHLRNRRLQRNPVLWLCTARMTAGLGRWGWCGLTVLVWAGICAVDFEDDDMAFFVFMPPVTMVAALGLGAAAALRREIEDGSVELLLVTPLKPHHLVHGRLLALWRDFLPAQVLGTALALLWMLVNGHATEGRFGLLLAVWSSFLAAPAVGLRLAIRRLNPVIGWGLNLLLVAGLPAFFALLTTFLTEPSGGEEYMGHFSRRYTAAFIGAQLAIAAFCYWCTVTDLATRRFQLKPLQRAVA